MNDKAFSLFPRTSKRLLSVLLALSIVSILFVENAMAAPVTAQQASRVAIAFWNMHRDNDVNSINTLKTHNTPFDALYVFTVEEAEGFVIVAADDVVTPILAYSFHNKFNLENNTNVQYWLSTYQEQIEYCRSHDITPAPETTSEWNTLSSISTNNTPSSLTSINPLLTTTWNQSPYYNDLCPNNSQYGQRAIAGCVATAMAQVMKYWNYPTSGQGSHSYYQAGFGTISANFGSTTYDWQNMPSSLSATSSSAQKNAVATLMYHCGVSIEMEYGVSSSGAYMIDYSQYDSDYTPVPCTEFALVDYFGYSDAIQSKVRGYFTDAQWKSYIKTELDASRPVLYSGFNDEVGHCFVCDGYNTTETHFHFNWGWGGYCDGYYTLANLAPTSHAFNQYQQILINVEPAYEVSTNRAHLQNTFTAADGTVTNCYVPVYSSWTDAYIHDQTVYPSSMLSSMNGQTITSLTYHIATPANSSWGNAMFCVRMMEIEASDFTGHTNAFFNTNDATVVYTGSLDGTGSLMTIHFTSPYTYNGGNLLIDISSTATGSFAYCYFYGISSSNASACGYNYGSASSAYPAIQGFIPKTTFGFGETTVADTSATSTQVPFFNASRYQRSQVIYPSSLLQCAAGQPLTSLTYFLQCPAYRSWGNATFTVKLKEVPNSTFSSTTYADVSDATTVFSGAVDPTQSTMTIDFTTPYQYNGGNLLVEIMTNDTGTHAYTAFYGSYSQWASLSGYSFSSNTNTISCASRNFLPKTQFTFPVNSDTVFVINYDSISTSYQIPVNNFYNYSLTETIIKQEELGGRMDISDITYYYNHTSPSTQKDDVTIWIQPTSKQNFSSANDIELLNPAIATQVYHGPLNCTIGANTIAFDSIYHYDGVGNLMIIVDDNSGSYNGSPYTFYTSYAYDYLTLSWYSDSNNPDPTSSTFSGSKNRLTFRPIMVLSSFLSAIQSPYDTISYVNDSNYVTSWGFTNTNNRHWGIMLPADSLSGHNYLKSVLLYVNYPGQYTLNIYKGGSSAPQNLAYTQQRNFTINQRGWQAIQIDTTFVLDNQNLWVTFHTIDISLPSAACNYTGNPNSNWKSADGTSWDHTSNASWLIKVVTSETAPENPPYIYISGQTQLSTNQVYTFDADASSNATITWNAPQAAASASLGSTLYAIWDTPGTYTVIATATNSLGVSHDTLFVNVIDYSASDTLSYILDRNHVSDLGPSYNGPFSWGVMFPSYLLSGRDRITHVLVGVSQPGTYTLNIYQEGVSAPEELIHSSTFYVSAADTSQPYFSYQLPTPISVDSTKTLWITIHSPGLDHPAKVCEYTTDPRSDFYSLNDTTWHHLQLYSWMIKIVTSSTTTTPESCTISSFPYFEGFEEDVSCWSIVDADNDGYNWYVADSTQNKVHSGAHAITSASYDNTDGILYPDNYLISPAFVVTNNNLELTYYISAQDQNYAAEHIAVYITTSINGISSTTPVEEYTLNSANWTQHTVSLAPYYGQTVYIAFRHYNCSDMFRVNIDDISIAPATISSYTISVTANNDNMGYTTGSGVYNSDATATLYAIPYTGYHFVQWNDGITTNPRQIIVTSDSSFTAIFSPTQTYYTITVNSNNANWGSVTGSGTYLQGTTVTLSATANTGYRFLQWSDGNTNATRSVTVNANATYTAIFEPYTPLYTITVNSNNSNWGTVTSSGNYLQGSVITISATPYPGYEFLQWTDGDTNATRNITVTSDSTFTAIFSQIPVYYTITVNSNNSNWGNVTGGGTYLQGTTITLSATANTGYRFLQWNDGNTNATRSVIVNADATYTAIFEPYTAYYTITVNSNDTSRGIVSGSGTYQEGSIVTIAATPNPGYHFHQWTDGDTNAIRSITVTSDSSFTALFEIDIIYHTLTVNSNNDNWGYAAGSGTYLQGSTVTISAIPFTGYHFSQWNDGFSDAVRNIVIFSDTTFTATFEPNTTYYNVLIDVNDSIMGYTLGGGDYMYGDTAIITAIPYNGYHFENWSDSSSVNPREIVVTGDIALTAHFAVTITYYDITVSSNNNAWGTVSGSGTYAEGTPITLTAAPNSGYHFVEWNDGDTNAIRSITVVSDSSFTAMFVTDTPYYSVTVINNNPGWGTVYGNGSYPQGTVVSLSATANSGYHFLQWNDGNTNAIRSITVTSDTTFSASFEQDLPNYTITVISSNPSWGNVTGGGSYQQGSEITIFAIPNSGYHFLHWNDNDTNAIRNIVVTSNATYIATFEADIVYYTITAIPNNSSMGSVSGSGTYPAGAVATLQAEPYDGYHFEYWLEDHDANATRYIHVNADATYTAVFLPNPVVNYTINVVVDPTMGVSVGSGTYAENTSVTIRAIPFEEYEFIAWNDGNTTNPRQITVTCDETYTAILMPIQGIDNAYTSDPTITLYPNPSSEKVNLTVEGINGKISIDVIDLYGRVVRSAVLEADNFDNHQIMLNTQDLPAGSYLVRIYNEQQSTTKRLILN